MDYAQMPGSCIPLGIIIGIEFSGWLVKPLTGPNGRLRTTARQVDLTPLIVPQVVKVPFNQCMYTRQLLLS